MVRVQVNFEHAEGTQMGGAMKRKGKAKLDIRIKAACVISVLLLFIVFCYWQNNDIVITSYTYTNKLLPKSFRGLKIVQVSDLHNKSFGKQQEKLLLKIEDLEPDVIFVTGDLIDSNRINVGTAMEFINKAIDIADVYYVTGNHEMWSGIYLQLKTELYKAGVKILDNEQVLLERDGESIIIAGVMDPDFVMEESLWKEQLKVFSENTENKFRILLSHRPEYFDAYAEAGFDLVFSGHAHGGQFRFPFPKGLYAPGQGFFPKLTAGIHKNGNTTLIISRGLGNSKIPLRLFNRPELILVNLQDE
jgi:predicted MPP superfamily phosphohydrolase